MIGTVCVPVGAWVQRASPEALCCPCSTHPSHVIGQHQMTTDQPQPTRHLLLRDRDMPFATPMQLTLVTVHHPPNRVSQSFSPTPDTPPRPKPAHPRPSPSPSPSRPFSPTHHELQYQNPKTPQHAQKSPQAFLKASPQRGTTTRNPERLGQPG